MNITEEGNSMNKPKVQSLLDMLLELEKNEPNDAELGGKLRLILKQIRKTY